jgi:Flp pilus assembly protein TadD
LLRRIEESERVYERLLSLDPNAEEALSNLVALSVERSDFVRIQTYSLRLLELSPQSITALQGLTLVALQRHDDDSAASYYELLGSAVGRKQDSAVASNGSEYCLPRQAAERLNHGRRARSEQDGGASDRVSA